MPPQVGQATTFSWVWLRRCSRSFRQSLKVQVQPGKESPVRLQPWTPRAGSGAESPDSSNPYPMGLGPCLATRGPQQSQAFFKGPTFPATQHHMIVLADRLVLTAQAVRFHVPIEPLRIVEGTLCQEQLGVRMGRGTLTPTCPRGAPWLSPKLGRQGHAPPYLSKGATRK